MSSYRKKAAFRAWQLTPELAASALFDDMLLPDNVRPSSSQTHPGRREIQSARFRTEGFHVAEYAEIGDWIVFGEDQKAWPCKPSDFTRLYEPTTPEPAHPNEKPASPTQGELAVKALRAMLDHYGPPKTVADMCEYDSDHPISLARAALSAPAEGWQIMETAPKDGTKFLAYDKGHYFDCWWYENGHGEAYWADEADSEPSPSYWMPLPAAPAIRSLSQRGTE